MATKTVVELLDDTDGTPADITVKFSAMGVDYEIDLSNANAAQFEKLLTKYTTAGRRVGGRKLAVVPTGGEAPTRTKEEREALRKWASDKGIHVAERGRIAQVTWDEYDAAMAAPKVEVPKPKPIRKTTTKKAASPKPAEPAFVAATGS